MSRRALCSAIDADHQAAAVRCIMAMISLFLLILLMAGCSRPETFSVTLVDVGYGAALLCRHHDGTAFLVDGGYAEEIEAVETALHEAGIESLALIVSTHGHGDHLEGVTLLLERSWPIGEVAGNVPWGHRSYDSRFWKTLEDRNIPYRHLRGGQSLVVNPFHIKIFHPDTLSRDLNESSLVCAIDAGDATLLLPSDIGIHIQKNLANRFRDELAADILLLPHHGDRVHREFLDAVSPSWALLSVGPNPWELPLSETFGELKRRNIRLIDTRHFGSTTLEFSGKRISLSTQTGPAETALRQAQMDERIRRWTGED